MRTLYFVPIIHSRTDTGSLAAALERSARAALGNDVLRQHGEVVSMFWDSIAAFFSTLEVSGFKVYQDGLLADGETGLHIVGQGVKGRSQNYMIIGDLLQRGAVLVKTEDILLVKQEHDYVKRIAESRTPREMEANTVRYKAAQARLLTQRDTFIAERISRTLKEDDTGILFLGAYHNVLPRLPDDIVVVQVKDVVELREYHRGLTGAKGFPKELAERIVSPVSQKTGKTTEPVQSRHNSGCT
ncbi:MAG: hypothetical protein A2147_05975 [Chloroflexi bacterium RBG_16_57_8]|nr:MAG: hypothetical protein A2147_05975 [Chloroflexi bacterium RBG_16_57_8]